MPIFLLAVAILVVLLITSRMGMSNQGCLAQLALWFALGVLVVPLLLVVSCLCR